MLEFMLNDRVVRTSKPSGSLLLDFIRYDQRLTGTKIGCREGDCGACTVLMGSLVDGRLQYHSATSCLTPVGNAAGKHIVTVEGLNMDQLSPVQQAIVEEGGTQCGFCTVGFVLSLTGFCLQADQMANYPAAIAAIDGNICRCTGYKSLERAAARLTDALAARPNGDAIAWLVANQFLPEYFQQVPDQLRAMQPAPASANGKPRVSGGTDLYVQQHDTLVEQEVTLLFDRPALKGITVEDGICTLGAQTTVADMLHSEALQTMFPRLSEHLKLVSSTPIRAISTLGGNFVNASPIGDMTAFFIALNAQLHIDGPNGARRIFLKNLYHGYKTLDLAPDELITAVSFAVPPANSRFNFEKVSKRTHLDIASVNTAILIFMDGNAIAEVHLSAGGIGPVPTFLEKTCAWLQGKELIAETVRSAAEILQTEISPISDVRGAAAYKRLLLRQLFYAHFITLFPETINLDLLR
ncbi:MAG: FAD binding domain-containing protein [Lewinellaceae bacterium]|nr:FAD binding domain-containing protein [Lewinellaceae bacterium]